MREENLLILTELIESMKISLRLQNDFIIKQEKEICKLKAELAGKDNIKRDLSKTIELEYKRKVNGCYKYGIVFGDTITYEFDRAEDLYDFKVNLNEDLRYVYAFGNLIVYNLSKPDELQYYKAKAIRDNSKYTNDTIQRRIIELEYEKRTHDNEAYEFNRYELDMCYELLKESSNELELEDIKEIIEDIVEFMLDLNKV